MPDQRPSPSPRMVLTVIMGGMALWAVYVAVGAYLYNFDPWRAVIVLGCMAAFLGWWLLLLYTQGGKKKP
jgi:hypothetical protein